MREPRTPEEALGALPGKPLSLSLRCERCRSAARFEVPWVSVDLKARVEGGDGVLLGRIFTCERCGAVDEYELAASSRLWLMGEVLRGALGASRGRVLVAESRLFDGTLVRRPSAALAHLRGLTVSRPADAEVWRRLGNIAERYGVPEEAIPAWKKAVEVGPEEFEAAYSLAGYLASHPEHEAAAEAFFFLAMAVERVTFTRGLERERREAFARELAELMLSAAQQCQETPLGLEAAWKLDAGSNPKVALSGADLRDVRDPSPLARFLASDELVGAQLVARVPEDPATQLAALLADEPLDASQWKPLSLDGAPAPVRATPRLGRNDPCSCGSGKKFKKCCGR